MGKSLFLNFLQALATANPLRSELTDPAVGGPFAT